MVRKQEQKDSFEPQSVSAVVVDLEKDLSHAVMNADKVIFAAGSKGENVIGVDQEGAKRLIDASGIDHIVKALQEYGMTALGENGEITPEVARRILEATQ